MNILEKFKVFPFQKILLFQKIKNKKIENFNISEDNIISD